MEKPVIFFSHATRDGKALKSLQKLISERFGDAFDVFLSSDGQSIAFGAGSRLWHIRLDDPRRMRLIETATAPILSLASHGDWEAYGQTDGVVILRNQNTGARFRIETEQRWPFGLRFSTAGDRLAVGGRSARVSECHQLKEKTDSAAAGA